MPFDYEATYCKDDIIEMVQAIAAHWKSPVSDVEGLDPENLLKTVRKILDVWSKAGVGVDYDFQALLALLRACDGWFSEDQLIDISCWLDIVSEAGTSGWQKQYEDDEAITEALKKGLSVKGEITITRNPQGISIVYKQGDYGIGVHDGTLTITNNSLCLFNLSTPKVRTEYEGDLPDDPTELAVALADSSWVDVPIEE
ncbi:hypothetical protein DIPPA_14986 [Diplonema papillatum]|nr:hypothetical protein DIPPA_14986 [Diplonema papillatum]